MPRGCARQTSMFQRSYSSSETSYWNPLQKVKKKNRSVFFHIVQRSLYSREKNGDPRFPTKQSRRPGKGHAGSIFISFLFFILKNLSLTFNRASCILARFVWCSLHTRELVDQAPDSRRPEPRRAKLHHRETWLLIADQERVYTSSKHNENAKELGKLSIFQHSEALPISHPRATLAPAATSTGSTWYI